MTDFSSGSPAAARPIVTKLCRLSGGRAFAPQYRLGPQHTFPAQLLDALVAYFHLLAPPLGTAEEPVAPSTIVLVGESAGASLSLALVQVLLHIRRNSTKYAQMLRFRGRDIKFDLPAGCALLSITGDWTFSLPSNQRHADTDIIVGEPWLAPDFPVDAVWPSYPPRGEAFCYPSALSHPLISPVLCRDWTDAPPMWICAGEETLVDSMMLIAQTAAKQGVPVEFLQYEGMPHVFARSLGRLPQAMHCYEKWAEACKNFVTKRSASTKATFFRLGNLRPHELNPIKLINMSHDEARELMRGGRERKTKNVFEGFVPSRSSNI